MAASAHLRAALCLRVTANRLGGLLGGGGGWVVMGRYIERRELCEVGKRLRVSARTSLTVHSI